MYFFLRIIDNFLRYGTLQDRRHDLPGPSTSVATEENIKEIENYFKENPGTSIRKAAQVLNISKSSLHRILRHFLNLHPYKITSHQRLTEHAMAQRVEFCNTVMGLFDAEELDEKFIIYTDEAHFWLDGYVNKQNSRFWGSENPSVSIAKSLHPQKVTVWAAISVKGVYLQILDATVTGESYKELLEKKFFPHARKRGLVRDFYFMQDGAAPHRTQGVFEAIHKVYGTRVIGLGYPKFAHGGLEWPPYSPDLNPCDYFLWGYIKDHCYADNPKTVDELVGAIKKTTGGVTNDMLERVFDSFRKRIEFCANSNGAHFENMYH